MFKYEKFEGYFSQIKMENILKVRWKLSHESVVAPGITYICESSRPYSFGSSHSTPGNGLLLEQESKKYPVTWN